MKERAMIQYSTAQERLNAINKDADTREVLGCIDRPIRPLIIQMNRIGIFTAFSCCGYSYDGEEEPKSHLDNPNVLFVPPAFEEIYPNNEALNLLVQLRKDAKDINIIASLIENNRPLLDLSLHMWKQLHIRNFVNAMVSALNLKWIVKVMPNNFEWGILFCDWSKGLWNISDGLKEAIHDYEGKLMAIRNLTEELKKLPTIQNKFYIRDDNEGRQRYPDNEWMIKPKQPTCIVINNNNI
jgi:hypothetical protein